MRKRLAALSQCCRLLSRVQSLGMKPLPPTCQTHANKEAWYTTTSRVPSSLFLAATCSCIASPLLLASLLPHSRTLTKQAALLDPSERYKERGGRCCTYSMSSPRRQCKHTWLLLFQEDSAERGLDAFRTSHDMLAQLITRHQSILPDKISPVTFSLPLKEQYKKKKSGPLCCIGEKALSLLFGRAGAKAA